MGGAEGTTGTSSPDRRIAGVEKEEEDDDDDDVEE